MEINELIMLTDEDIINSQSFLAKDNKILASNNERIEAVFQSEN